VLVELARRVRAKLGRLGVYDAAVGNIGIAELLVLGVIGLIPLLVATAVVVLVVARGRRDEERGAPRR
jgi:hypothetical protein